MKKTKHKELLTVRDLKLHFRVKGGTVQAVDGVDFDLPTNQATVILGESGCGKSSLAKAVLRLLPRNVGHYSGEVFLDDLNIMGLSDEEFRQQIRWKRISMVPQAALNSLNPVMRVGDQVAEPILIDNRYTKAEAMELALEKFDEVGVPADFLYRYAFELSGGMRQRVAIAMSLITEPQMVLLDEPTSALDVLTQANIMNLLKRFKAEKNTSFILITHDIATSSELADNIAVMYAGQIVEISDARNFFSQPLHPYSGALMASVPRLRSDVQPEFISGQPPSLLSPPTGCRFAARCPARFSRCSDEPPMFEVNDGRKVKCWLHESDAVSSNSKSGEKMYAKN
ncbi:MAG: ABC transporter ATP-binding protein [Candidatus Promineifilaceae bacterium]